MEVKDSAPAFEKNLVRLARASDCRLEPPKPNALGTTAGGSARNKIGAVNRCSAERGDWQGVTLPGMNLAPCLLF